MFFTFVRLFQVIVFRIVFDRPLTSTCGRICLGVISVCLAAFFVNLRVRDTEVFVQIGLAPGAVFISHKQASSASFSILCEFGDLGNYGPCWCS